MAYPTFNEMQRSVFIEESHNPDELVGCPFLPAHFMKRKKLPIHIPTCREKNGKGFLACSYSGLHFFRTKAELKHHEVICPMRRQCEGTTRAAPSGQRQLGGEEDVSVVMKMLKQRRQTQMAAVTAEEVALADVQVVAGSTDFVPGSEFKLRVGADPDSEQSEFMKLHRTVLFSEFRVPQILPGTEPPAKWASDLESVQEEGEEVSEAEKKLLGPESHSISTDWYAALKEREKQDECRNDRPKTQRPCMEGIGIVYNNRWEDLRDASSDPVNYAVDWSVYAPRYRKALKAKYDRDREMLRTGKNPRYVKSMDHPNAPRNNSYNPLMFLEQAAWYEDLVWKPANDTFPISDSSTAFPTDRSRVNEPDESPTNCVSPVPNSSKSKPWDPTLLINQVAERMKAVDNQTITTHTKTLSSRSNDDDVGIAY